MAGAARMRWWSSPGSFLLHPVKQMSSGNGRGHRRRDSNIAGWLAGSLSLMQVDETHGWILLFSIASQKRAQAAKREHQALPQRERDRHLAPLLLPAPGPG